MVVPTPRAQTLSARKLNDQKKSGVNCAYGNSLVGESVSTGPTTSR